MRFISVVLLIFICGTNLTAKDKEGLKFNQDSTFKILQLADTHLCAYDDTVLGEAEKTFTRMSGIIKKEKPDLLVFTGDVVTSYPAAMMWNRLIDTLNVYNIPFAIVYGNHDPEVGITRSEIASIITASPLCLNAIGPDGELADIEIPVMGFKDGKPASMLYCLDSHDYSKIEGIGGYGWFERGQVDWLYDSCMKAAQAAGTPLPSLAFFHIPLPEFGIAWNNQENDRMGVRKEAECAGKINAGMFAAMVESDSIMGVFCGHDHDNDYIVAEHGIALAYGRYSGDETVYNNLEHGIRVIVLKEGKREFDTWIREDLDGNYNGTANACTFRNGKLELLITD